MYTNLQYKAKEIRSQFIWQKKNIIIIIFTNNLKTIMYPVFIPNKKCFFRSSYLGDPRSFVSSIMSLYFLLTTILRNFKLRMISA